MILDTRQITQDYIEDCEVCCRGIIINLIPGEGEEPFFEAKRLDE